MTSGNKGTHTGDATPTNTHSPNEGTTASPPIAPRHYGTRIRNIHGETFDDPWDWLRNDTNPETLAHIAAENRWTDHITTPLQPLRDTLVAEMKNYTVEDDVSAPIYEGNWWYYQRYQSRNSYPSHHRILGNPHQPPTLDPQVILPGEETLVDENIHAAGHEFFRLSELTPSPNGTLIAWARDVSGDERWTWIIQQPDGKIIDENVTNAGYGIAWAQDNEHFLYTRVNDAWRSHEIWIHRIGTPQEDDTLLLHEPDEGFDLWISRAKDPRWVALHSSSTTSGQAWLWSRQHPLTAPLTVTDRQPLVQVKVEPAGDHLLIVHTQNTQEGSLAAASLPRACEKLLHALPHCVPTPEVLGNSVVSSENWVSVREPVDGERIIDVEAFSSFAVVSMRSSSLSQVAVHKRFFPAGKLYLNSVVSVWNDGEFIDVDSPVRTLISSGVGDFDAKNFYIEHHSVTTPVTAESISIDALKSMVLKRQIVPGWNPEDYIEERFWVPARDGHTQIPITLVRHRDVKPDGTNPGWLHGYGSYEVPFDAEFDILRLPALSRGFVHVIAHIRGGGEMGRAWYEDGKELRKVNTFTDFIDVALWLHSAGWVASDRLIAEGRSAGGLLMGAVTNMAPEAFRAVLAGVPFVDALTTILDPSLPLTVGEWEEWGNPLEDVKVFELMRSYTPYENVRSDARYPAIMATTSLNDTRVFYVEPTKWVQRLREVVSESCGPIVLRTEMVAGHGGRSGRYGRWEARAEEFAFVMSQVGVNA